MALTLTGISLRSIPAGYACVRAACGGTHAEHHQQKGKFY
jgi:hypothetical protein